MPSQVIVIRKNFLTVYSSSSERHTFLKPARFFQHIRRCFWNTAVLYAPGNQTIHFLLRGVCRRSRTSCSTSKTIVTSPLSSMRWCLGYYNTVPATDQSSSCLEPHGNDITADIQNKMMWCTFFPVDVNVKRTCERFLKIVFMSHIIDGMLVLFRASGNCCLKSPWFRK